MLKVSHITMTNKQRHLLTDVSFVLPAHGFCAITAKEKETEKAISYLLAGMKQADAGFLQCDETKVTNFSVTERSRYRTSCVTSWFGDFLFLPSASVKENIVLQYAYEKTKVKQVLQDWQLSSIAEKSIEEVSFQDKVKTMLARSALRTYRSIIFYPDSTPFSKEELQSIYQLLKIYSEHILVIVVGDPACHAYSERILEFREGILISDNQADEEVKIQDIQQPGVTMQKEGWHAMFEEQHRRYRWPYHALKFLTLMSLILVCILWSTTSLDIVNIELGMLQKDKTNSFVVHKIAQGDDGTLYPALKTNLSSKDVSILQKHMKGNLLCSYVAVNATFANAYLEGIYDKEAIPLENYLPVVEANTAKQAGIKKLQGHYPTTFDEVCLSLQTAHQLFHQEIPAEKLLHMTISWYGLPLRISGVFEDEDGDKTANGVLGMHLGYPLYVKSGYLKQHPLSKMKSFPSSNKRLLHQDHFVNIQDIQPIDVFSRFYNGKQIVYYTPIAQDEIVLDVATAIEMGFPYERYANDETMSYQEKLYAYIRFADEMIGKQIQVQAYTIEATPINSMLYRKNVKIAGFLLPSMDMMEGNEQVKDATVYMDETGLADVLVKNVQIKQVTYQGNSVEEVREALQYLNTSNLYEISLKNSLLLQVLVIDFKELFTFFAIASIFFLGGSVLLYFLLLHKTIQHQQLACSVYYVFGERKDAMRKLYEKTFLRRWRKYLFVAIFITTILLWGYIILILLKLSADVSLLMYLLLPACVGGLLYFSMQLATRWYLKHSSLLLDAYAEEV